MTDETKIGLFGLTWRMGGFWSCMMGGFAAFALGIWLTNAGKANQLEEDGVVTTAVVTSVRQERVFRSDSTVPQYRYTSEFRFETETGEVYTGTSTQAASSRQSGFEAGDVIELRYSRSDPTVFEMGEGTRGRDAGFGLWAAIALGVGAVGYGIWSVIRAAGALRVRDGGEAIQARVVAGPANEKPVRVHLELPDGRRIKNRLTPIKGPYPRIGGTDTVYVQSAAAWWSGDLR